MNILATETSTPRLHDKFVARMCNKINRNSSPYYVQVKPHPDSVLDECFSNVSNIVSKNGGREINGWIIWKWPNVQIEGIFHRVWEMESGDIVDPTPQSDGESKILFLPDPTTEYKNKRIWNIRMPLRKDQVILDMIDLSNLRDKLWGIAENSKGINGEVSLPKQVIEPIHEQVQNLIVAIKKKSKDSSLCFCNSGKKYKQCHALIVRRLIEERMSLV